MIPLWSLSLFITHALGSASPRHAIPRTHDETVFIENTVHYTPARVEVLPRYNGTIPSEHYAGYITVDEVHQRKLYYYFVTSERNPKEDPFVLWLNGGPGCSSFDGFMYEHGPLRFKLKDTQNVSGGLDIIRNVGAWSKVANVLYLDSPSGVGMSFSGVEQDYITNDTATAHDSNIFLRKFFVLYPDFASHDFYISGESYAGVYVPALAREILRGNDEGQQPLLKLKGYLIGNGVTDPEIDGNALVPFARGKSLISEELFHSVEKACQGNFYSSEGQECKGLLKEVDKEVSDLNLYDILEPCYRRDGGNAMIEAMQKSTNGSSMRGWPLGGAIAQGDQVHNFAHILGDEAGHPPCLDHREMTMWLDDPEVRKAINAAPMSVTGPFQECTSKITYTHNLGSMIPLHKELLSQGLRMLIYNGDHDMCVPHTGAEAWTRSLGLPVQDPWRSWQIDDQVAGFTVGYKGLRYATILGAGHFTPEMKPLESLLMFERFLSNQNL